MEPRRGRVLRAEPGPVAQWRVPAANGKHMGQKETRVSHSGQKAVTRLAFSCSPAENCREEFD